MKNICDIKTEINNMRKKYVKLASLSATIRNEISPENVEDTIKELKPIQSYIRKKRAQKIKSMHKSVIKPTFKLKIKNINVCRKFIICNTASFVRDNKRFLQVVGTKTQSSFIA